MASSANVRREENGHHHNHNDAVHHHQTSWIGRKTTKTRSTPRPSSTGVNGSGKGSSSAVAVHRSHEIASPPPHPIKPQSWSETNMESPAINRLRMREKVRPVSAAISGKLRQQRERRRTKRRGPYMPSTEGTSTGDEEGELFQMDNVHNSNSAENKSRCRNSAQQQGEDAPPPSSASRRFSSPTMRRMSKSPSDLDADDEDNQDYDSASMVSASELLQARVRALQNPTADDDAVFNAQFQEIRMAGMQQLAEIDILDKERREKSALIQELGQKEQRIYEMEKVVMELNRRLLDSGLENENLKAENRALLQAMAKLSAAE